MEESNEKNALLYYRIRETPEQHPGKTTNIDWNPLVVGFAMVSLFPYMYDLNFQPLISSTIGDLGLRACAVWGLTHWKGEQ